MPPVTRSPACLPMVRSWSRETPGPRIHGTSSGSLMQERKAPPAILINDLRKDYGATHAVNGISFTVNKGEIFGLIGPDGAGKTTTFQILAGVMKATSGVAEIFGRPARSMRSQTGYLTQTFSLYPDLSVNENIRYIGDLRRVPPEKIVERGGHYLDMFA